MKIGKNSCTYQERACANASSNVIGDDACSSNGLVNMQRITMSAISRALLNTLPKIQKVTKSEEGMRAQVIIPASMRNKTSLVLNRVLVVTMHALT